LKPKGRLIVSCGGLGNAQEIIAMMNNLIKNPKWAVYFADFERPYFFYSTEDYKQWLPKAGFHSTRLELAKKDMIHTGREGLASWIRTTWMPYTHRVPQNMRQTFIMECVDAYLKGHFPDDSGHIHVKMVRLEVEAHI
jgi:trans-aconitate 2-methyltransferase